MEVGLVFIWLIAMLALGLAAVPLAAWVFPRGDYAAYAFTVGLVVVGVVAHLVGYISFRWPALLAGIVVLLGLSAVSYTRVELDRRLLIEAALLFTAAFLVMVTLRAMSPGAGTNPHWVGEMFLDYGLLSSLERSGSLPPEDMWFAGEPVRYHFGGHLLTSLLAGLTMTAPAYAYNLGLAAFFAALVTMAWGVGRSIARPFSISSRLAAAMSAFFVAIAGNLDTVLHAIAWLLPDGLTEPLADLVGADSDVMEWSPGSFFYWDASRIITRPADGFTTATEFPLFSWLHADLHAHVLVKPLLLLLVAVGVAYWYTPPTSRLRRRLLVFGVMPPLLGLIAVVNMWSFPIGIGLIAVFLLFAPGNPLDLITAHLSDRSKQAINARFADGSVRGSVLAGLGNEAIRVIVAIGLAAIVTVAAIGWSAPYWWYVVLGGPGESITTWDEGTSLGQFLIVMGAFIVGFAIYLGARLVYEGDRPTVVLTGMLVAIGIGMVVFGWPVLAVGVILIVPAWWWLREDVTGSSDAAIGDHEHSTQFGPEVMLLIAGLGIVLIVELVKLQGDTFNSIFKPYADIWQLWAVALGVIVVRLVDGWPRTDVARDRSAWAAVMLFVVVLLVLSTGLYAAFAIPTYHNEGNTFSDATAEVRETAGYTLDATVYLEVLYPEEAEAIRWLETRDGQPTIASDVGAGYFWIPENGDGSAAPSSLTGLPTVLGWEGHERQYRGSDVVDERRADLITLFTGDQAEQEAIIDHYEIEYIYIGPAEERSWLEITIDAHPAVEEAASFETVTIYEVNLDT